jgi:hypothetical protein
VPQIGQRLGGGGRDVLADRQPQAAGEFGERGGDQLGLLGGDPPDQVVVAHEPVHVLQGDLRLADTAEAEQRLRARQHDGHAAAEFGADPLQAHAAAGEGRVARRHVPDPGQRAGEARRGRAVVHGQVLRAGRAVQGA